MVLFRGDATSTNIILDAEWLSLADSEQPNNRASPYKRNRAKKLVIPASKCIKTSSLCLTIDKEWKVSSK